MKLQGFRRIIFAFMMLAVLCFPSQGDDRTLNAFIQTLEGNDSHARMEAAVSLGDLGDSRAVEPLIKALKDNDEYVRDEAARALGKIGDHRAVDPLIQVLREYPAPNFGIRYATIGALAWIADPRSIDALSEVGVEDDYKNQEYAVWGIARTKDPRAIDPLINVLPRESTAEPVARMAIAGLVAIGNPAVEPLIHAASDNNFGGREAAVIALGEIGDARAVEPLVKFFEDTSGNQQLRREAIYALGIIGDVRAIDPLIKASKNPDDADLQDYASEALVKINKHVKFVPSPMPEPSFF